VDALPDDEKIVTKISATYALSNVRWKKR